MSQPFVVKIADRYGNPISGVAVAWLVTGGGTLSAITTVTDTGGTSQVTLSADPNAPGAHQVIATYGIVRASTFTLTAASATASANEVKRIRVYTHPNLRERSDESRVARSRGAGRVASSRSPQISRWFMSGLFVSVSAPTRPLTAGQLPPPRNPSWEIAPQGVFWCHLAVGSTAATVVVGIMASTGVLLTYPGSR